MKKSFFLLALCFLFVSVLFVSCEQKIEETVVSYKTPTIKGLVDIPENAGLDGSSFYIKVVQGEDTVYSGKLNADGSFVVSNLKENQSYDILISSEALDRNNYTERSVRETGKANQNGVSHGNKDNNGNHYGWGTVISDVEPSTGNGNDVGEVAVKLLGFISGTVKIDGVTDKSGIMVFIPGTSYIAITDEDGSFTISDVPQNSYSLKFMLSGYLTHTEESIVLHTDSTEVCPTYSFSKEISLIKNSGTVSGTAEKVDSQDNTGITVLLSNEDNSYTATTQENGNYSFSAVVPGTYSATVSYYGFVSQTVDSIVVVAGNSTSVGKVSLDSVYGAVSGVVKDSENNPISLAVIEIGDSCQLFTNENGEFSSSVVPTGTYSVKVSQERFQTLTLENNVTIVAGTTYQFDSIKLSSKYGSISGTVGIEGVADNSGIQVLIVGTSQSLVTGSSGDYNFDDVAAGTYDIQFSKADYVTLTVKDIVVTAETATTIPNKNIELAKSSIAGTLILEGAESSVGASVTAYLKTNEAVNYTATVSAGGNYYIPVGNFGAYRLEFYADNYFTDSTKDVVVNSGIATVSSVTLLSKASTVFGKIQLEGASDYRNATVVLRSMADSSTKQALTDQDGNYVFTGVVAGEYKISANKTGYSNSEEKTCSVSVRESKELDTIELLLSTKSLSGRITFEDDTNKINSAGITVTATLNSQNPIVYSAVTNLTGYYGIGGVQSGDYIISFAASGYETKTLDTIHVDDAVTTNIPEQVINIARGTISGTAKLEGWTDCTGVLVKLYKGETLIHSVETDNTGAYSLHVPQGNYSKITFEKDHFTTISKSVDIALFANNTVPAGNEILVAEELPLVKGKFEIQGTSDYSGINVKIMKGTTVIASMDTTASGEWSFADIAIDRNYEKYSVKTHKLDIPDKEIVFANTSRPVIDLGTYTLIPESSTITGFALLKDESDNKNIQVTVSSSQNGYSESVFTAADGLYTLSNIPYTYGGGVVDYTVTYSKTGWDSVVKDFSFSKAREVKTLDNVTLVDTTAPVITGFVLDNGNHQTNVTEVSVALSVSETGSGATYMKLVRENEQVENITPIPYFSQFDYNLSDGNGGKSLTVYVYDKAGNVSSPTSYYTTLTDQKVAYGDCKLETEDELNWSKLKGVYRITNDVVVPEGKTLEIGPGTQIEVTGPWTITVHGTLHVNGEENDMVHFYSSGDSSDPWMGIRFESDNLNYQPTETDVDYISGNLLRYTKIDGNKDGITGNVFVDNCIIDSDYNSIGYFATASSTSDGVRNFVYNNKVRFGGVVRQSQLTGKIGFENINDVYFINNRIQGDVLLLPYILATKYTKLIFEDNICSGDNYVTFYDYYKRWENSVIRNNDFESYSNLNLTLCMDILHSSFRDIDGVNLSFSSNNGTNIAFNSCCFENVGSMTSTGYINLSSNFCDLSGLNSISIDNDYSNSKSHDFRNNYWGEDRTAQMSVGGANKNYDFINDYYDTKYMKTELVYEDWLSSTPSNVGYRSKGSLQLIAEESYENISPVTIRYDEGLSKYVSSESIPFGIKVGSSSSVEYLVTENCEDFTSASSVSWLTIPNDRVIKLYEPSVEGFDLNKTCYLQTRNNDSVSQIIKIDLMGYAKGPAGGYILYDFGPEVVGDRFLEEGSSHKSGELYFGFMRTSDNGSNLFVNGTTTYNAANCTSLEIGYGKSNTEKLIQKMTVDSVYSKYSGSEKTSNFALKYVHDLSVEVGTETFDNWFLPSHKELILLKNKWNKLGVDYDNVFGFFIWTSSEKEDNSTSMYCWNFNNSTLGASSKNGADYVIPFRSF